MAVEIKELIIKAVVADSESASAGASNDSDRDRIVQECVDQVLKILKRTSNR
jgi:hypothetical protein